MKDNKILSMCWEVYQMITNDEGKDDGKGKVLPKHPDLLFSLTGEWKGWNEILSTDKSDTKNWNENLQGDRITFQNISYLIEDIWNDKYGQIPEWMVTNLEKTMDILRENVKDISIYPN